jgi:hypothetical protein
MPGAYDELLQAAGDLGFTITPDSSSIPQVEGLSRAQQVVQQCTQVHELELRLSALSAHLASRTVTDQQQLAARAAGLSAAASTLQLITASKDIIADRLRSASLRPSVPVAPEYQQDFAQMLRSAASNAAVLQDSLQVLQWAACLSDRPSCWEDQLRVIRDSAQAFKECMTAMQDFDQQLTQSTGDGATGGALVCAGGVTC